MEDVKVILIDLFTRNISLTKDDGTTPATITVTTKWYDDKTMDASDGIVTVGTLDDTVDPSGLGDASEDHLHVAEINVWTASKFDSSGNQVVTDETMRWKLCPASLKDHSSEPILSEVWVSRCPVGDCLHAHPNLPRPR